MLSAGGLSLRPSRPGWDGDGDGAGWAGPRGGTREVGMSPAALAAGLDAGGCWGDAGGAAQPWAGTGGEGKCWSKPKLFISGKCRALV